MDLTYISESKWYKYLLNEVGGHADIHFFFFSDTQRTITLVFIYKSNWSILVWSSTDQLTTLVNTKSVCLLGDFMQISMQSQFQEDTMNILYLSGILGQTVRP